MNKTIQVVLVVGMFVLLTFGLYCWYNKDRYQYVHYEYGAHHNVTTVLLDKNKGIVYENGLCVDYPNAKTVKRKFRFTEE